MAQNQAVFDWDKYNFLDYDLQIWTVDDVLLDSRFLYLVELKSQDHYGRPERVWISIFR